MRNAGILKSQLFTILLFVFSLALVTIAGASPPGEDELKQLAAQEKAKPAAPSGPDGDYVGSKTCIICHQDQDRRFKNTVMGKAMAHPHTPEEARGCESCHGPGRAHVEAGGGKDTIPIRFGKDSPNYLGRKAYFTTYYSLSAGKGNVFSRPLGDPTITTGPNQFALIGTNSATNYPETVNRNHEVVVVFRYNLTERLAPKIEYHYQQWDYKDYQTSPMTQYMGCVSPIPNGSPGYECCARMHHSDPDIQHSQSNGSREPVYPYFVVGDTSAACYLFLGVDQLSYHAHTILATLEYRF